MKRSIAIFFSLIFLFQYSESQSKHLRVDDSIPVFTLQDQDGKSFNSADYAGKSILVIYFYPKDESSVCTKEACSFRDNFADFMNAGAMVIGINQASVETHKKFQSHHNLPFTLLSDPGNKVLKMFGVKNKFFLTGRETFIIDKAGKIVFRFDSFSKGKEHQEEALKFVKSLTQ